MFPGTKPPPDGAGGSPGEYVHPTGYWRSRTRVKEVAAVDGRGFLPAPLQDVPGGLAATVSGSTRGDGSNSVPQRDLLLVARPRKLGGEEGEEAQEEMDQDPEPEGDVADMGVDDAGVTDARTRGGGGENSERTPPGVLRRFPGGQSRQVARREGVHHSRWECLHPGLQRALSG